MIISLLSAQSRTASAEAAAQLKIAINRILAFGHVHRRLHLLDRQESVEFKQYLKALCEDLSGLLSFGMSADAIVVEGDNCSIPATLSRPFGLIVSELITNAESTAKAGSSFDSKRHRLIVISYRSWTTAPDYRRSSSLTRAKGSG